MGELENPVDPTFSISIESEYIREREWRVKKREEEIGTERERGGSVYDVRLTERGYVKVRERKCLTGDKKIKIYISKLIYRESIPKCFFYKTFKSKKVLNLCEIIFTTRQVVKSTMNPNFVRFNDAFSFTVFKY